MLGLVDRVLVFLLCISFSAAAFGENEPTPTVSPTFQPFPPTSQPAQGGGEEPHAPVFVPAPPPEPVKVPTYKPFERPLRKKESEPRRVLIPGRGKYGYRSAASFEGVTPAGQTNDYLLFLQTLLREAENDALIAKHEHDVDLINVEQNRSLHAMNEKLLVSKAVTPMDFEQTRAKLRKSEFKSDESKAREQEYIAEQELTKIRIEQTKGKQISLGTLARAYARIWEVRVDKVIAVESQARVDWEYFRYAADIQRGLYVKHVATKEDVIRADRDVEDAAVVLRLATKLREQNKRNWNEALESASEADKAAERAQVWSPSI